MVTLDGDDDSLDRHQRDGPGNLPVHERRAGIAYDHDPAAGRPPRGQRAGAERHPGGPGRPDLVPQPEFRPHAHRPRPSCRTSISWCSTARSSADELNQQVQALQAGKTTIGGVFNNLYNSAEFNATSQPVAQVIESFFPGPLDVGALRNAVQLQTWASVRRRWSRRSSTRRSSSRRSATSASSATPTSSGRCIRTSWDAARGPPS